MPTQALRDALAVAELPPLVCPEREEVEPAARSAWQGGWVSEDYST